MTFVTDKFRGPAKVALKMVGINSGALILELKNEDSYLSITNGAITSYRGVSPQPYRLRQVARISQAQYTEPLAVKSKIDESQL